MLVSTALASADQVTGCSTSSGSSATTCRTAWKVSPDTTQLIVLPFTSPPAGSVTVKPEGTSTVTVCVSEPSVKSPKVASTVTVPVSPGAKASSPLVLTASMSTVTLSATASTSTSASTGSAVAVSPLSGSSAVAVKLMSEPMVVSTSRSLSAGGVRLTVRTTETGLPLVV